MGKKRFIVELGAGIDLHGADVTEAACRAVKDAISSNCPCGLCANIVVANAAVMVYVET